MTTVADFVKDALGAIGVVDPRQPVQAVDMETAIRFLNRVCTRMEANTLALGWSNVDSASDTLPLPPEAELGVMYVLAMALAPQFMQPIPADVRTGAEQYMTDLRRDQAVATPLAQIVEVPTPARWGHHSVFSEG